MRVYKPLFNCINYSHTEEQNIQAVKDCLKDTTYSFSDGILLLIEFNLADFPYTYFLFNESLAEYLAYYYSVGVSNNVQAEADIDCAKQLLSKFERELYICPTEKEELPEKFRDTIVAGMQLVRRHLDTPGITFRKRSYAPLLNKNLLT